MKKQQFPSLSTALMTMFFIFSASISHAQGVATHGNAYSAIPANSVNNGDQSNVRVSSGIRNTKIALETNVTSTENVNANQDITLNLLESQVYVELKVMKASANSLKKQRDLILSNLRSYKQNYKKSIDHIDSANSGTSKLNTEYTKMKNNTESYNSSTAYNNQDVSVNNQNSNWYDTNRPQASKYCSSYCVVCVLK